MSLIMVADAIIQSEREREKHTGMYRVGVPLRECTTYKMATICIK